MTGNPNVLALSMDGGYVDQARQVLSALHRHARWPGDYLILCDRVPAADLAWFHERGVMTQQVETLFTSDHLPPVTFSRYALLREDVRRWDHVVFLDLDVLVRGPLDALTGLDRLGAVRGYKATIRENFDAAKDPALYRRLDRTFDLDLPAFNGGMLAFPTSIVGPETFDRVCALTEEYLPVGRFANQGPLNLAFADAWTAVSPAYNAYIPTYLDREGNLVLHDATVLHFNGRAAKPWVPGTVFHERFGAEWSANLRAAWDIARFPLDGDRTSERALAAATAGAGPSAAPPT